MTKPIKNNSQLLYLQARQLFEQARTKFEDGTIKSEPKLVEAVFNSFQEFFTSMGKPNMVPRYAPEQGPPWSQDYNSMMSEIRMDLELLFQELDILGRSIYTDFNHNMVQHDILNKQFQDVLDKMRDLEAYAGIGGEGVELGRDDFLSKDKIDYARISGTPLEIVDGAVTLPQTNRINVAETASVTIVAGNRKNNSFIIGTESNGFPGNNTEIHSVTDDVLTNQNYIPTFLGEENNHSDYTSVLDGNPNTWFEYEKVNVREHDKVRVAKNLGWDYQVHENQTVMWAEDPEDGILKLHVQILLKEEQVINQINCNMYTPPNYGAKTAVVKNILVSDGKEAPRSILPANKKDDQYSFHFQPMKAKVVSILFEQRHKYITDIGHIFYEKKMQVEDSAEYAMDMATKKYKYAPRVDGPLVSLEDLGIGVSVSDTNVEANYPLLDSGDTVEASIGETINRLMGGVDMETVDMGVEKFEGFRWCIGIRDIEIFSSEYATEGELVTYPFFFDNPLDKISLNVNENIPSAFTANDALKYDWIKYYVSINDGGTWYPITPMSHEIISEDQPPKIYTVRNIETSEQVIDYKKAYIESEYPVYSLRMKIVARRPDDYTLEGFSIKDEAGTIDSFTQTSPIISAYLFQVQTLGEAMNSEESDRTIADIGDISDGGVGYDPSDPTLPGGGGSLPPGSGGDDPWGDDDGDGIPNWQDPDDPDYVPNPPDGWEPPGKPPIGTPDEDDDGDGTPNQDDPDWKPPLTVRILNKKFQWCMDQDLLVRGDAYSQNPLSKVELIINNTLIDTKVFSGTTTYERFDFIVSANTFDISTITIILRAYDSNGTAVDTDVLSIIDCTGLPPEDQPQEPVDMSQLSVTIDRKISSLCECDELVLYGSAQGPNPIQSLVFRMNGQSFDPNNLGTPPADDPCGSSEVITPSVPEPTPSVEEPNIPMNQFLSNTSNANTSYWTGKRDMPSTIVNGTVFNPRDDYWGGRNDWLDLVDRISGSNPPFASVKVDTSKAFYGHLYEFIVRVKEGGVSLPEPFSKFNAWCDTNLTALTRAERGTIYASYKFQKPAIIHPSGLNYLEDGVLDTMAHYMVNPKLKAFSYHWIDFADVKPDEGVLAWVMDIPQLPALLSYMNFEETAMNAGIGNMKAIRPIDYKITAGQGFNAGTASLNEAILKNYYLETDHFAKADDYFTVQALDPKILGIYAAMESAIHEAGHAISNYGTEAYPTATNHRYASDAGKNLHDYLEWQEISGWDRVSQTQDGTSKFSKSNVGFLLDNGKEAPVSTYGCTSPAEDFAEAFDFYVMNPRLLQERYPKKYAFMEKYVKDMNNFEITPFALEEMPESIEVELHYKSESHREAEVFADFGEWLEEFERREDCGCKNKKKTVTPVFQMQATPFYAMATGTEQSFHVVLPYWKLRQLGAQVGVESVIEVTAIDSMNQEATDSMRFMIKDCDTLPVDEEGNPRVQDCWSLESIEVHYYSHESHSIESKVVPANMLPYGGIVNGAGSEITIGWRTAEKAPIVMLTSGNDESGYAFQLHAVGLHYLNEYGQPQTVWAQGTAMKTETVHNEDKMMGDPSRETPWTLDMENGDYSTAPSLGQRGDYAVFMMSNEWLTKACTVNAPNFNPEEHLEEEEEGEKEQLYECNDLTHIVFQVYDEQSKELKMYKIDVSASGKDTYTLPTKNGSAVVTVGWVNYFKGPVIQIKEATGTENILLTAIGLVYRDMYGDSQTSWSTQLRYKTNGVRYPEFVIGEKKELIDIDWVQEGTVDYEKATYVGRQGDMVAYLVDEMFTGSMCEPEKPIDEEVGIDPENPPDLPRIDFMSLPDGKLCINEGTVTLEAVATDNVGLKEVEYAIFVNGIAIHGPHTDSVFDLEHTITLTINTDTLIAGDTVRFYMKATNLFNVSATKSMDIIAENCEPVIPEQPCGATSEGGSGPATYYYTLGETAGEVVITYDFFTAIDKMDVYYKDQLVAATGNKTGTGTLRFNYAPTADEQRIKIVMNDGESGSSWNYTVNCPVPATSGGSDEEAITNNYKVLARLKWGATPSDMDFHAYVDRDAAKHLGYNVGGNDDANHIKASYRNTDGSMYLNYDWTGHNEDADFNSEYEVITIDGFANKTITFIAHRFTNGAVIDESHPPTVEIVNEATGAVVQTIVMPASDWTTNYMRVVEIQLDANGNFQSVVRNKASITGLDPTL